MNTTYSCRQHKKQRCPWCGDDPLYVRYPDHEWGVPIRDDRRLFEMLFLEGAQAGLSWITVLKKRDRYREVFHGFCIARIAAMTDRELEVLLTDPGIIRNRLKVFGFRRNARACLEHFPGKGDLSEFLWSFVDNRTIVNRPGSLSAVPCTTSRSDAMSRALKKKGFTFVGSTICYAFMQAAGLVDDHLADCYKARTGKRG